MIISFIKNIESRDPHYAQKNDSLSDQKMMKLVLALNTKIRLVIFQLFPLPIHCGAMFDHFRFFSLFFEKLFRRRH